MYIYIHTEKYINEEAGTKEWMKLSIRSECIAFFMCVCACRGASCEWDRIWLLCFYRDSLSLNARYKGTVIDYRYVEVQRGLSRPGLGSDSERGFGSAATTVAEPTLFPFSQSILTTHSTLPCFCSSLILLD